MDNSDTVWLTQSKITQFDLKCVLKKKQKFILILNTITLFTVETVAGNVMKFLNVMKTQCRRNPRAIIKI